MRTLATAPKLGKKTTNTDLEGGIGEREEGGRPTLLARCRWNPSSPPEGREGEAAWGGGGSRMHVEVEGVGYWSWIKHLIGV